MGQRIEICGLPFEAVSPSYYQLVLPSFPQHVVNVDISYIGESEWVQCLEIDGAVSCKVYGSRDDAVRPLARAFGTD